MSYIFRIIKWIIILAVVFAVAFLIYGLVKINQPLSTQGQEKVFEVKMGMSTKQVAARLEEQNLINDAFFFELFIYFAGSAERVQAGKYVLSSQMSVAEIARQMTAGEVVRDLSKVTVIEGWDIDQIAEALETAEVTTANEFYKAAGRPIEGGGMDFSGEFAFLRAKPADASLEGFLFPDTYFFEKGSPAEDAAKKMLRNFDSQVNEEIRREIEEKKMDFYGVLKLASIIEREVGRNVKKGTRLSQAEKDKLQEERRLVASVFYNRLDQGMRLESDATVAYITGSESPRSTLQELEIDSPYNTYRYQGLPPTPIASPSLNSILAAVRPAESDYLYFLTSPDGTAYFAETFEGHQRNREKYLE